MRIAYTFLATGAEFTSDGRLWVLGGDIDSIGASSFPVSQPGLCLVIKFLFSPDEVGQSHTLQVDVIRPNGERLGPSAQGEFKAQGRADGLTRESGVGAVVHMSQVPFQESGEHTIHISVDGQWRETLALYLRPIALPTESEVSRADRA